ncbi:hypothetical protein M514_09024 [Trichuris suis]|uniref:Uncharacterized protein n=1 Tax=Trichuris suis TaxID=68888 RepID=A0A085LYL8_9BILA|nr:hypothetical protein M513_09024 [Trichuris suis]KFD62541.1 hypothetical protein M514_09024 [Trichuris suis]
MWVFNSRKSSTGRTLPLLRCTTAIRGMRARAGPNFLSSCCINQPFRIHDISSSSYAALLAAAGGYSILAFCKTSGALPFAHFHAAVHERAVVSYVTTKFFSSMRITALAPAQAGVLNGLNCTYPSLSSRAPPSNLIALMPSTKSKPSGLRSETITSTSVARAPGTMSLI